MFNQRDLQILENELRISLNIDYEIMQRSKREAKRLWEMCDKNNPKTEDMFNKFSEVYKKYKYHKTKLNQLAALQAKIKRAKNGA